MRFSRTTVLVSAKSSKLCYATCADSPGKSDALVSLTQFCTRLGSQATRYAIVLLSENTTSCDEAQKMVVSRDDW